MTCLITEYGVLHSKSVTQMSQTVGKPVTQTLPSRRGGSRKTLLRLNLYSFIFFHFILSSCGHKSLLGSQDIHLTEIQLKKPLVNNILQ